MTELDHRCKCGAQVHDTHPRCPGCFGPNLRPGPRLNPLQKLIRDTSTPEKKTWWDEVLKAAAAAPTLKTQALAQKERPK